MSSEIYSQVLKSLRNEERQMELERKYSANAYEDWLKVESKKKEGRDEMPSALHGTMIKAVPEYASQLTDWLNSNQAGRQQPHVKPWIKSLKLDPEVIMFTVLREILKRNLENVGRKADPTAKYEADSLITYQSMSYVIFDKLVAESCYKNTLKQMDDGARDAYQKNVSYTKSAQYRMATLKHVIKVYKLAEDVSHHNKITSVRPIIDLLLNNIKVGPNEVNLFVLDEEDRAQRGQPMKVIRWTKYLEERIDKYDKMMSFFVTSLRPMVCPPRPWTNMIDGGYLTKVNALKLVSRRGAKVDGIKVSPEVMSAVNAVQDTEWQINKSINSFAQMAFSKGGPVDEEEVCSGILNKNCILFTDEFKRLVYKHNAVVQKDSFGSYTHVLPDALWHVEYPKYKEAMKERKIMESKLKPDDWAGRQKAKELTLRTLVGHWKMEKQKNMALKKSHDSKVLSLASQLQVASDFKNEEAIYFPHTLDFRGRLNAKGNFLTPQGNDSSKALLSFTKGKPLGPQGEYWLSVHGANLYSKSEGVSVDKLEFDDRVKFIKDNMMNIVSSTINPLGTDFWQKADKPLCFLAFCFEYRSMLEAPKAEDFVSHLPIAMDATCSGLQHYSALLRDEEGGAEVNLIPGKLPRDIYKKVSEVATRRLGILIEETDSPELNQIHRLWLGKVDRTLCKRATMTKPYGVTPRGVVDQLRDLILKGKVSLGVDPRSQSLVDGKMVYKEHMALTVMADIIMESVNEVVKSAAYGQDWLQGNCEAILKAGYETIIWESPLGFQCKQSYEKMGKKRMKLFLSSTLLWLQIPNGVSKTNKSKEKAGVAANFIHSLDACHLQYCVNEMNKYGITSFAMVHDSFGTHAGDVHIMNTLIRKTFVDMYTEDLLQKTYENWKTRYPEADIKSIDQSKIGSLDINWVKRSKFFFS